MNSEVNLSESSNWIIHGIAFFLCSLVHSLSGCCILWEMPSGMSKKTTSVFLACKLLLLMMLSYWFMLCLNGSCTTPNNTLHYTSIPELSCCFFAVCNTFQKICFLLTFWVWILFYPSFYPPFYFLPSFNRLTKVGWIGICVCV